MPISVNSSLFMIDSLLGHSHIKSEPQPPPKNRGHHPTPLHSTPDLLQNFYALYASRMSVALTNNNNTNNTNDLNLYLRTAHSNQSQLNSSGCSTSSSSFASSSNSSSHSPISLAVNQYKRSLDYSHVSESSSDLDIDSENTPVWMRISLIFCYQNIFTLSLFSWNIFKILYNCQQKKVFCVF